MRSYVLDYFIGCISRTSILGDPVNIGIAWPRSAGQCVPHRDWDQADNSPCSAAVFRDRHRGRRRWQEHDEAWSHRYLLFLGYK